MWDERIEIVMGKLLRIGVILAAVTVLIGGIFYLFQFGFYNPHYVIFNGEPAAFRTLYSLPLRISVLQVIANGVKSKMSLWRAISLVIVNQEITSLHGVYPELVEGFRS